MAGYSFLPTLKEPTTRLSYRLTKEEKQERDEWMIGAKKRGMSISEIAFEVGLSIQRTTQILKQNAKAEKAIKAEKKKITPRDAAITDFYKNSMHVWCRGHDGICNDCFGMLSIIESEYDSDGWPYPWAMVDQEQFIAAASER